MNFNILPKQTINTSFGTYQIYTDHFITTEVITTVFIAFIQTSRGTHLTVIHITELEITHLCY